MQQQKNDMRKGNMWIGKSLWSIVKCLAKIRIACGNNVVGLNGNLSCDTECDREKRAYCVCLCVSILWKSFDLQIIVKFLQTAHRWRQSSQAVSSNINSCFCAFTGIFLLFINLFDYFSPPNFGCTYQKWCKKKWKKIKGSEKRKFFSVHWEIHIDLNRLKLTW